MSHGLVVSKRVSTQEAVDLYWSLLDTFGSHSLNKFFFSTQSHVSNWYAPLSLVVVSIT